MYDGKYMCQRSLQGRILYSIFSGASTAQTIFPSNHTQPICASMYIVFKFNKINRWQVIKWPTYLDSESSSPIRGEGLTGSGGRGGVRGGPPPQPPPPPSSPSSSSVGGNGGRGLRGSSIGDLDLGLGGGGCGNLVGLHEEVIISLLRITD